MAGQRGAFAKYYRLQQFMSSIPTFSPLGIMTVQIYNIINSLLHTTRGTIAIHGTEGFKGGLNNGRLAPFSEYYSTERQQKIPKQSDVASRYHDGTNLQFSSSLLNVTLGTIAIHGTEGFKGGLN